MNLTDIINTLVPKYSSAGFDVRVVGGAVRDVLQDKPPTDIDMTTTAKPDQIVSVCTDEGIKHILTGTYQEISYVIS